MHIAICDDDSDVVNSVTSILDDYKTKRKAFIAYKTYSSATELVSTLKSGQYDLMLLDILMPGFTGIQAAQEVRTFDKEVKIIFLTSSPEFALDSYSVKARDYMLKPVCPEKLFAALDLILSEEPIHYDGFSIKTQNGISRILFSTLVYVEIINKHLHFHLADGTIKDVCASMLDYEDKLLVMPEFIKVHRSYIVNLWQMRELGQAGFTSYNGDIIPVSRLLYSNVRQAYINHIFIEKGVK